VNRRAFLSRLFEGAVLGTALALGVRPESRREKPALTLNGVPFEWTDLEIATLHPEDFSIPAFVNGFPSGRVTAWPPRDALFPLTVLQANYEP
jgi:hypothetical protein